MIYGGMAHEIAYEKTNIKHQHRRWCFLPQSLKGKTDKQLSRGFAEL